MNIEKKIFIINEHNMKCLEIDYEYRIGVYEDIPMLCNNAPSFNIVTSVITREFQDSLPTSYELKLMRYIQEVLCDKKFITEVSYMEQELIRSSFIPMKDTKSPTYRDSLLSSLNNILKTQALRLAMDENEYKAVSEFEYKQIIDSNKKKEENENGLRNTNNDREYGMKELIEVLSSIDQSLKTLAKRADDFYIYK